MTFSSHMWVKFTKNEEYITTMSGKTPLFFIIEFDVFVWDSKKPQKMQILGFALPAKWVIRSSPFSCLAGLNLWEADPEHMCQLKMCCFKQIFLSLKGINWTISVESLTSNRSVRVLVVVIHEGYPQSNLIEVDYFASKIGFVIGFTFAVYLVCWYLNQAFWHVLGF